MKHAERTGSEARLFDVLFAAAVLGLFGVFLFTVRGVLTPPVVFLALIFVLTPLWGRPIYRILALTAGALFLLWALREMGSLLAPFVLAFILAYVLDPLVDQLERIRLPRSLAIAVLSVPVAAGIVFVLVVGLPALGREASDLVRELPEVWEAVARWMRGLRARLVGLGIPGVSEESLPRVGELDAETIADYVQALGSELARRAWSAALGLGRGIVSFLTVIGYLVLTPVLTFYLLRDYDRILVKTAELIPRPRRQSWGAFAAEYHDLLSRYLRGQVAVAASVGVLTFLGFSVLGFPFALLLGAVAGVFNLVPYLGLYISLVPALAIALLSGNVLLSLLKVAIVFAGVQILEGAVLSPTIVGRSVEMNPIWILLALAVFGFFFGFVGLLLGVPLAILVKLATARALAAYRASEFYGPPPASAGPSP